MAFSIYIAIELEIRIGLDSASPWPSDVSRIAQSFPVSTRVAMQPLSALPADTIQAGECSVPHRHSDDSRRTI